MMTLSASSVAATEPFVGGGYRRGCAMCSFEAPTCHNAPSLRRHAALSLAAEGRGTVSVRAAPGQANVGRAHVGRTARLLVQGALDRDAAVVTTHGQFGALCIRRAVLGWHAPEFAVQLAADIAILAVRIGGAGPMLRRVDRAQTSADPNDAQCNEQRSSANSHQKLHPSCTRVGCTVRATPRFVADFLGGDNDGLSANDRPNAAPPRPNATQLRSFPSLRL